MSTLDKLLSDRYSCRQFDLETEVSSEHIEQIINAGRVAPSACNRQPYYFYGVGANGMVKLNKLRPWYSAPAMILLCRDRKSSSWVRPSDDESFFAFDAGIAMMAMSLKATELGLGSCFIASFDPMMLQDALNLPEQHEPYIALILGYCSMGPSEQHFLRKGLHEIATILD